MRVRTREIVLAGVFAALTAVGAFIRLPLAPVPLSLQTFFVLLSGIMLGPWVGALSQVIYLLIGLSGLPVFTGGGGFGYVLSPSFGYLAGFVVASFTAGMIARRRPLTFLKALAACAAGSLAVYAVGVPYLFVILNLVSKMPTAVWAVVRSGMLVFLPGDLLKSVAVAAIALDIRASVEPVVQKFSQRSREPD